MVRRSFDFLSALVGLVVLSPPLLILGLVIKLTSPGPVFHCGRRVGLNGRLFTVYKFRTMIIDTANMGPGITSRDNPRITRVGRFLRQTKIDELPQLINVLKGDMSLVGPRPEDPRYIALYTPEQKQVLHYRPGITSAASLTYRHEEGMLSGSDWETEYRTKILPAKLSIDLAYLSKRTLLSDFLLIVRTILAVFH